MSSFLSDQSISTASWQAFERMVSRLLLSEGLGYVSVIGRSGDGGADVVALKGTQRWLFQVKHLSSPVGGDVVDRTVAAVRTYDADIPVIVSKSGFTADTRQLRSRLAAEGINLQLWDRELLLRRSARLDDEPLVARPSWPHAIRDYQEDAIQKILNAWTLDKAGQALVVLATGLGKTFVVAEAMRRLASLRPALRVMVIAHTNDLVYQLERAFWPFLRASQATAIVNGVERPPWSQLAGVPFIFASRDTLDSAIEGGVALPEVDVVIVDECHHLGAPTYNRVLEAMNVGAIDGPFLVGVTATPWRPDGSDLSAIFDGPVVSIDLVQGLQRGFLSNVDYRMFTDNVDWESLRSLRGDRFSPRAINRTLFINQWDDAVVDRIREAWQELQGRGRGVVFCGTVEHADKVAARINALGFTNAKPIYSRGSDGKVMSPIDRSRLLWDFADGRIGILCSVDVLNEGVDVPDVNLVVFQRVTHSRRIFMQQLGRGLRLAPDKDRVVVLDFVSDVRRFAAGLVLQRALEADGPAPGNPVRVTLPSAVSFRRANGTDIAGANFLREWLGDLRDVEDAGEDVSVLRFPPADLLNSMTPRQT